MEWYYARGDKPVGPVEETDFNELVNSGEVSPETLVWHAGMEDWQEYGELFGKTVAYEEGAPGSEQAFCAECSKTYPVEDMFRYKDVLVCESCKPTFIQKLKEGIVVGYEYEYGGFWIRFGAKLIDWIILGMVNGLIGFLSGLLMVFFQNSYSGSAGFMIGFQLFFTLIQIVLNAAYATFFVGKYGATPGKMACKLKIIVSDGGDVSYLRALGRHFAEFLSGMILLIGYIIAAFDEEKRTLHDRLCDTRVIKTES